MAALILNLLSDALLALLKIALLSVRTKLFWFVIEMEARAIDLLHLKHSNLKLFAMSISVLPWQAENSLEKLADVDPSKILECNVLMDQPLNCLLEEFFFKLSNSEIKSK